MMPKWFVFTALTLEGRAIARALGVPLAPIGQPTFLPGASSNEKLLVAELHIIGIRAVRLVPAICAGTAGIILAGLAGALDPALRIGDIVISQEPQGGPWPDLPYRQGRIHCVDRPVLTPEAKSAL